MIFSDVLFALSNYSLLIIYLCLIHIQVKANCLVPIKKALFSIVKIEQLLSIYCL